MSSASVIGLVNNAALLLALGILYDMLSYPLRGGKNPILQQILAGVVLGGVGIAIMLTPWDFGQGVVFDTRSVLLCIAGLFFGVVPTLLAVLMTSLFRLFSGGAGAWAGIAVIITSGGIGLIWRHFRRNQTRDFTMGELYLMGVVVHVAMLSWMLTLPWRIAADVLSRITLPVLLIYPAATAALGKLIVIREKRKLSEEALRESEEKFRSIFQRHSAVQLILDPETGNIINANEAAGQFYGWSIEQLKKMRIQEINTLSPEDINVEIEKARTLRRIHFEFKHRLADGSVREVEVYSGRIEVEGKELLHSIVHDITDRKRAQEALSERERILKITQSLAKIGGWEWDVSTKTMSWTDETYAIHDLDPAEFNPSSSGQIAQNEACYAPEDARTLKAAFQRCLEQGEPYDLEFPFTTAKGRLLWIRTTAEAVRVNHRTVKVVGNIMDITDRKQAEEKLIQSHDLLSNLARLVPGVIYQFRLYPDGRSFFPYASPGMNDIYEVSPEEVQQDATPVYTRLHPDDYDQVVAAIQESARTLQTFYCEFRVILPRQGLRWRWSQAHPERMKDGSVLWHGIISDITRRKEDEAALAHSHDLMRYIIENVNSAVAVHDRELRYIYVSQRYLDEYGIKQKDVIGKHHYDVFPDLPQTWRDVHQKALAGEVCSAERDAYPRADGTLDWTRWECRPWYEADGSVGGIVIYTEIITDQVMAEEALRKSEERLNFALHMSRTGGWDLDLVSHSATRTLEHDLIFGYETLLPVWTYEMFLEHVLPEDRTEVDRRFQEAVKKQSDWSFECRIRRVDGEIRWIWAAGSHMPDDEGRIKRMAGIVQDITGLKKAEEEREKINAQFLQAQKMESVGRLAGGVAHDYNNMLSVIIGYAEMAMEKLNPADPLYADMEEILKAAERSKDITRQLLAFSRQQAIAPRQLDLNETVEGMLKMLRRLIGEDIDLAWLPSGRKCPLQMDPTQLGQILANLCVNARDAIGTVGKITIETDTKFLDEGYCAEHPDCHPGSYVVLSVSDDGCGMDRETQLHLFEPFFTTKEIGKGTGLGLATVYGIVKQNNGFIYVYSEPGQGSIFKICLPRHEDVTVEAKKKEVTAPDARGNETILLVEDEKPMLRMTTLMLERLGYRILAAETPNDAIHLAKKYSGEIRLLMTDVIMPGMNGRELSELLQARYPDMKILFVSGYTADVIAHRGMLDHGVKFIQKPFSKKDLAVKVRESLDSVSTLSE